MIPSGATYLGLAHEVTRGTYRAPSAFLPIDSNANSPNDLPHTASDTNMRGSAVDSYDEIATVIWAEPDYSGNVFVDTLPYIVKCLLGDETSSGTSGSATTLSAQASAGATSCSVAADPTGKTLVQLGGSATEIRAITTTSGAGPYTVNFAIPLERTHASGASVVLDPVAPFTHILGLRNSGDFQPPSLSLTHFIGDSARGIPGALCSSLSLKWTATGLLTWAAKFIGFQSAAQSTPSRSFSNERAKPAYQSVTTLGGSPILSNSDGELDITRDAQAVPTCDGTTDPYGIFGGKVSVKGKINLIYESATFSSEYAKLLGSTSTSLDLNWTSGVGAATRAIEAHMSQVLYTAGKPQYGKAYVELPFDFSATANVSDVAASGGYSPLLFTFINGVGPAY